MRILPVTYHRVFHADDNHQHHRRGFRLEFGKRGAAIRFLFNLGGCVPHATVLLQVLLLVRRDNIADKQGIGVNTPQGPIEMHQVQLLRGCMPYACAGDTR